MIDTFREFNRVYYKLLYIEKKPEIKKETKREKKKTNTKTTSFKKVWFTTNFDNLREIKDLNNFEGYDKNEAYKYLLSPKNKDTFNCIYYEIVNYEYKKDTNQFCPAEIPEY